jgi:hypothetical protein
MHPETLRSPSQAQQFHVYKTKPDHYGSLSDTLSLFLIAAGAILTFALNLHVGGVNLDIVGWILIVVGALGLIVTMVIWGGRRGGGGPTTTYVEERRDVGPPL